MRQLWKWTPVFLLLFFVSERAFTADPETTAPPREAQTEISADEMAAARARARASSRLMVEIDALLEGQREALAALEVEVEQNADPARAAELQRRIAMIKDETELRILEVQLSFARQKGDQRLVEELELGIASLKSPPSTIERQAREPRPSASSASGH